jgi:hypothetical protein
MCIRIGVYALADIRQALAALQSGWLLWYLVIRCRSKELGAGGFDSLTGLPLVMRWTSLASSSCT